MSDVSPAGHQDAFVLLTPICGNKKTICVQLSGPSGDSAASMLLDPLGFLQNVTSTYQPVVGLIMGGEEVILVADPAAAKQVLIDKAAIYKKVCT